MVDFKQPPVSIHRRLLLENGLWSLLWVTLMSDDDYVMSVDSCESHRDAAGILERQYSHAGCMQGAASVVLALRLLRAADARSASRAPTACCLDRPRVIAPHVRTLCAAARARRGCAREFRISDLNTL